MRRDENRATRDWGIGGRRAGPLRDDIVIFLQEIADQVGLVASVDDVLSSGDSLSADAFAEAVLRAEGWPEPRDEHTFRPELVRLFSERYGQSVSASDYRH